MRRDELLTVHEAAEALGCSESSIWNWVANRRLGSVKFGGRRFIMKQDLEKLTVVTPADHERFNYKTAE